MEELQQEMLRCESLCEAVANNDPNITELKVEFDSLERVTRNHAITMVGDLNIELVLTNMTSHYAIVMGQALQGNTVITSMVISLPWEAAILPGHSLQGICHFLRSSPQLSSFELMDINEEDDSAFRALLSAASIPGQLEILDVTTTSGFLDSVVENLRYLDHLHTLALCIGIDEEQPMLPQQARVLELAEVFQSYLGELHELKIYGVFEEGFLLPFFNQLATGRQPVVLTRLSLKYIIYDFEETRALTAAAARSIGRAIIHIRELQEFEFPSDLSDQCSEILISSVRDQPSINNITIKPGNYSETILPLFTQCQHIIRISIDARHLSWQGFHYILEELARVNPRNLKTLELDGLGDGLPRFFDSPESKFQQLGACFARLSFIETLQLWMRADAHESPVVVPYEFIRGFLNNRSFTDVFVDFCVAGSDLELAIQYAWLRNQNLPGLMRMGEKVLPIAIGGFHTHDQATISLLYECLRQRSDWYVPNDEDA